MMKLVYCIPFTAAVYYYCIVLFVLEEKVWLQVKENLCLKHKQYYVFTRPATEKEASYRKKKHWMSLEIELIDGYMTCLN